MTRSVIKTGNNYRPDTYIFVYIYIHISRGTEPWSSQFVAPPRRRPDPRHAPAVIHLPLLEVGMLLRRCCVFAVSFWLAGWLVVVSSLAVCPLGFDSELQSDMHTMARFLILSAEASAKTL